MSRILGIAALLSLLPMPAMAQQTRSLVVPPGSAVVIAPRGDPTPRTHFAPPRRSQQQRVRMVAPSGETLSGPNAWAAAGMAAAAAAAVIFAGGAGGSGSSGGSTTASASTTTGR
jgi:hypothetical protein